MPRIREQEESSRRRGTSRRSRRGWDRAREMMQHAISVGGMHPPQQHLGAIFSPPQSRGGPMKSSPTSATGHRYHRGGGGGTPLPQANSSPSLPQLSLSPPPPSAHGILHGCHFYLDMTIEDDARRPLIERQLKMLAAVRRPPLVFFISIFHRVLFLFFISEKRKGNIHLLILFIKLLLSFVI